MPAPCIIIPAHNEADTIAATLRQLDPIGRDPAAGQLIIACNGCTDDTAAIARSAAPAATVLTLDRRGKCAAINQALEQAAPGTVIVVDADVLVSTACLAALTAAVASGGVMAASPGVQFDLGQTSWPVRAYVRVFARHPYLHSGVGGAGVIALSAAGRAALGTLPDQAADDHYVRSIFPPAAQRRVDRDHAGQAVFARVRPPYSLGALVQTERRMVIGVRDVHRLLPAARAPQLRWLVAQILRHPIDGTIYAAVKLWARLTVNRHRADAGWETLRK
jgi:glycosyltransferase involved in cell wall biosynthesis